VAGLDIENPSTLAGPSGSAIASTALSSSSPLTLDDPASPPVGAPAADVARKWNFDGRGRDDLVFRDTYSNNIIVVKDDGTRSQLEAPTGYRLLAAADFTGDGIPDLLFSSVTTGSTQYLVKVVGRFQPPDTFTIDVFTTSSTTFNASDGQFGRTLLSIGDLNGDGRSDIVLRDAYDGSGDVSVRLSSGATFGSQNYIFSNLSYAWSLAGVGDINGDGRDDLIWRKTNNTVSSWLMNASGLTFTSAALPSVGHKRRLEAVTRLNSSDQVNDLVWRNVVSGRTIGWLMNSTVGGALSSVVELGTFGFDLEYVNTTYNPSNGSSGGTEPNLIWRRTNGSTVATSLTPAGTVAFEKVLYLPVINATHFRTKIPEVFDTGARGMWGPSDVLEPTRARNFGGMGASGGNTGRIPLVQAQGGLSVLYASGGTLAQFTPQSGAGGNFTLDRNLVLVGMGDFNSDGVGIDLLVFSSTSLGIGVFQWNTATSRYDGPFVPNNLFDQAASVGTRCIGFGQVDTTTSGTDLVFQDLNGTVGIARFNVSAGSVFSTTTTLTRTQSRDWIGQGVVDLTGDGIGDIVWRNASTGAISYWAMNSADLSTIRQVNINTTPVTLEWDLVGMGDLDGDGDGDLIWRCNTDGFLATWLFAGGQLGSVAGINSRGWDWRFEGTSDVNGDGKTDLIWRNANGQYAADLMNGATVTSTILSGAILFDRATMGWNQAFMRSL
jgi:hypothetical protein